MLSERSHKIEENGGMEMCYTDETGESALKEAVTEQIEVKLGEILLMVYRQEGITSGDITPLQQFEWDNIKDKLADLLVELIKQNRESQNRKEDAEHGFANP